MIPMKPNCHYSDDPMEHNETQSGGKIEGISYLSNLDKDDSKNSFKDLRLKTIEGIRSKTELFLS